MTQFLRDEASDSEEVLTPLMLDGTYLSRNFATLGPFLTLQPPCVGYESTLPLPSLRLLSRAPSTTFQGPGTHILHWGRHAKEIPAAVGYGRGSKSNSGRPSPLAPTHKRLPAAGALSRLHGRRVRVYGRG